MGKRNPHQDVRKSAKPQAWLLSDKGESCPKIVPYTNSAPERPFTNLSERKIKTFISEVSKQMLPGTIYRRMNKEATDMELNKLPSIEELHKMAQVDLKEINVNELVDIDQITIRKDLPEKERMIDYIKQVKNPYCYLSHGVVVKISFSGKDTLEDCLARCINL